MAAALFCAPLVYPWYLVWLAPFLIAVKTLPLTIWTVSILSTYVAWQLVGVPWGIPAWTLLVEYGAVLGAAVWLWRRGRWRAEAELNPAPAPSTSAP
jgi:hypothetical protein